MSWVRSIGVALLTGMVALFGAGTLASLIVEWHDISSFEGGAGFFVVGMALLGGCAGFVVGLIVARVVVRERKRPFLTGVGASCATVASILALAAGVSWLLADIPPQIDGEELFMLAEIRWPESGATAPASIAGVPYLRLGALRGSTVRRLEHGALFVEDARQESGRWIVPGAVPIFTSRGGRLLDFGSDGRSIAAFEVPLPRYPWELHRQWSAWLPTQRAGEPARADQFTYRFKVVLKTEPLRTDTIGSFEVDTIVDYFYPVSDASKPAASATFRVRYKGQPIPEIQTAETVSAVAASRPALFVTVAESASEPPCVLLVDEGGTIRVERVKGCGTPVTVGPLTSDSAHFDAARTHERLPGWVDRVSFARPGLFQLDSAILDTRNMTTVSFLFPDDLRPNMGVPPLDLSPDEQSFVWLVQGPDEDPRLGITNWRTGVSHVLPIDRSRMRYNTPSSLGPQWVRHHFQWIRGPERTDVLAERPAFAPLPYRGDLALGKAGEIQTYTLRPGGEPLRTAMVNLLVRGFGGERMPDEPGGYQQRVRLNGKVLGVSVVDSPGYVYISMDAPDGDPQAMKAIATKLDAALATGEYDALFVAPEKNQ